MTKQCINFLVEGRVQGVFFRDSTQRKATEIGLTGWVRNLTDGRVELVACGEVEQIEQLEQWIQAGGPPAGSVNRIEKSEMECEDFREFEIKY